MDFSLLTIYYEDHGGTGIAYDLTISKRSNSMAFAQLKQFVEMLKAHIPASDRVYDPRTKVWTIGKTSFDSLLKIMQTLNIRHIQGSPGSSRFRNNGDSTTPKIDPNNFFYNTIPAPTVQTRESISESLAQILGCSVSDLSQPLDVVKKLYRKKALELHPDRNNGDGSRMSELNSLWSVYNAN